MYKEKKPAKRKDILKVTVPLNYPDMCHSWSCEVWLQHMSEPFFMWQPCQKFNFYLASFLSFSGLFCFFTFNTEQTQGVYLFMCACAHTLVLKERWWSQGNNEWVQSGPRVVVLSYQCHCCCQMSPQAGRTSGVAPGGDWNVLGEYPQMGTCREIDSSWVQVNSATHADGSHRPCAFYRLHLPHLQHEEGRGRTIATMLLVECHMNLGVVFFLLFF